MDGKRMRRRVVAAPAAAGSGRNVACAAPDGRSGAITISAKPRGNDDVEIIFADNGAGMTPDVQRQAFDPFFTTRRNEGGTGLGLHIVYNLVTTALKGRITLHSVVGQGTEVQVVFPRVIPD